MANKDLFCIQGSIRGARNGRGIPGLTVQGLDQDLVFDDRLGTTTTDTSGRFEIRYQKADFSDFFERQPDIYLRILAPDGALLMTTEQAVRFEAGRHERFDLRVPAGTARISDGAALRRCIVENPVLQAELATAVAALFDRKALLDPTLACTLVPVVVAHGRSVPGHESSSDVDPQPEPPVEAWLNAVLINPQPEPPGIHRLAKPEPDPWVRHWWWIGVPSSELLQALDRLRLTDLPETAVAPVRDAANLGYRIMADRASLRALSQQIGAALARHGVVLAPGAAFCFVPVVYPRPLFAGEVLAPCAAAPQVLDLAGAPAGQVQVGGGVNPFDGIPPPDLLLALKQRRASQPIEKESQS